MGSLAVDKADIGFAVSVVIECIEAVGFLCRLFRVGILCSDRKSTRLNSSHP